MNTTQIRILVFSAGLAAAFSVAAQQTLYNPEVNEAIQSDVSPPVGALVLKAGANAGSGDAQESRRPKLQKLLDAARDAAAAPVVTKPPRKAAAAASLPISIGVNVLGVGNGFPNYFVPDAPSDVNLAVGDTQVVQWVNVSYAVFDKKTGALIAGPIDGNQFWSGFGDNCDPAVPRGAACRCQFHNDGDIIVQWDKLAHRWLMSQSVFNLPYETCVAVSTTADATGTFYRYVFPQLAGLPDYPKFGIMPDAYYQTQNAFSGQPNGGRYMGAHVCAYERSKMLIGAAKPKQQCFTTGVFDDSLLPADLDSAQTPPPMQLAADGSGMQPQPEVFLGSIDNFDPTNSNVLYQYLFHVDFLNPNNSTFTGAGGTMPILVNPFGLACGGFGACIQQPGVFDTLDSLGDRLMYRLAYRNFGDHQTWLVSHSVTAGSSVGERWYEFRSPATNANLSVYQQGTFAPDGNYRWMGSLAMDKVGNIALGYSQSSSTVFPSIFVTGRTPGDALGTMRSEVPIVNGTGSQVDTVSRWGDYTSMAIDAADDCTMWYTNQYYSVTDFFNWSTRVASLKFSTCR
jgi:hypothetical protein